MTPIIDCEGMFGGDRMAKLSDRAKLFWPWLYLASNGYARFEINYRRILQRVFSGFADPPTEEQFVAYLKEYCDAYLLFTYRAGGQLWGQWDTSAKCLPRHKTTADERSPIPPADEYVRWREEYSATKCEEVPLLATFAEKRGGISRDFAGFRGISREEKRREEKRSEENSGEKTIVRTERSDELDQDTQSLTLTAPEPPEEKAARRTRFLDESHDRFYGGYWRRVKKPKSRAAWPKAIVKVAQKNSISAIEAAEFLIARMQTQKQQIETRTDLEWLEKTHPSSWLNAESWEDDLSAPKTKAATASARTNLWSTA